MIQFGNMTVDADKIVSKLYIGRWPLNQEVMASHGYFTCYIYCAVECKEHKIGNHFHYPMRDQDSRDDYSLNLAELASDKCAELVRQNNRLLITCAQGINRSALVLGLTMLKLNYQVPIVAHIRQNRETRHLMVPFGSKALSNDHFADYLDRRQGIK